MGAAQSIGWLLSLDDKEFLSKLDGIKTRVQNVKEIVEDAETGPIKNVVESSESFSENILKIGNTAVDVVSFVASSAVSTLKKGIGVVGEFAVNTVNTIGDALSTVTGGLVKALGFVHTVLKFVLGPVTKMFGGFWGALKSAWDLILKPFQHMFNMMLGPFMYMFMPMIQRLVLNVIVWVLEAIEKGIDYVDDHLPAILKVFETINGVAIDIYDGFKSLTAENIWNGLKFGFSEAMKGITGEQNFFSEGFNSMLEGFGIKADEFWGKFIKWKDMAWQGFKAGFDEVWKGIRGETNFFSEGFNGILRFFGGDPDKIWGDIIGWKDKIVDSIVNAFTVAKDSIVGAIEGIITKIQGYIDWFTGEDKKKQQALSESAESAGKAAAMGATGISMLMRPTKEQTQSNMPRMKAGGIVTKETRATLGEGGNPEAVIPLPNGSSSDTANLAGLLASIASGSVDKSGKGLAVLEKIISLLSDMRDSLSTIVNNTENDSWVNDIDFDIHNMRKSFER